jgi:hypothetical protein
MYDTIKYKGRNYPIAIIPDVFCNKEREIIIGSNSLNNALYNEEEGYPDKEAEYLDEQIYAFMDEEYFNLSLDDFISVTKRYID